MNTLSNKATSTLTVHAPGRINLIGEHTDYNDGYVLPAAIDKYLTVKLKANDTDAKVKLTATDLDESFDFDLQDFSPAASGWPNYVMGVVHELQKKGAQIKGFDASFNSQVPIGSGMSSSAALECGFAVALNELFRLGFDHWALIKAAQMAEHNFVGIRCGIMDQFASMLGQKGRVMLLDCRSLNFEYFPLELERYELLLLNTNVSHNLATSAYNTRRAACEEGAATLNQLYGNIQNLRDVSMEQLRAAKAKLSPTVFKRCHHVVAENQRVLQATQALTDSNHRLLGQLMYQSHTSLAQDFEVSCPELDFLVQQTLDMDFVLGSRMMGGGFGGCTINIIERQRAEAFVDTVSKRYKNQFGLELTPITVATGNGAQAF
ncbi:MAG TPA: galactokinase [Phaeodactylibacter sp.]|nr:galactokinase [Phaeodactylibacter sp.]